MLCGLIQSTYNKTIEDMTIAVSSSVIPSAIKYQMYLLATTIGYDFSVL